MNKKFILSVLTVLVVGAIGYYGLANLIGLTDTVYRVNFGSTFAMAACAILTAWFLLSTLPEFKDATKNAYKIIVAGIGFYALVQLEQLAVILLFSFYPDLPLSDIAATTLFLAPYTLSVIAIYAGLHKLARTLSIKTWPVLAAIVTTIIVAVGAGSLVQIATDDPSAQLLSKVLLSIIAGSGTLVGLAAIIAMQIHKAISSSYRQPTIWLASAVGMLAVASLQEVAIKGSSLVDSTYAVNGLDLLPFVFAGLLFLKAGSALKEATFETLPTKATYIDAVIYTAQLVSTPAAVDKILNPLRQITARLTPGATLTPSEKSEVLAIYLELEKYLVTKEPLRKLTRTGLRSRLTSEFQHELSLRA